MADRWCKLLARTRASDKVSDAIEGGGPDAWLVFSGLMMIHAEFGVGGKLDAGTSRPGRIRNELSAFMLTKPRIAAALDALEDAGLLTRDDAGAITLRGWGDDVAPACVRCHRPNPEPSKATCPSCRAAFARARERSAEGTDDGQKIEGDRDRSRSEGVEIASDRDPIEGDRIRSLRDMDRDADLYRDAVDPHPPSEGSPQSGAIHSESAAAAVDVSLLGPERQTRSYASTSGPVHIADILPGAFRGRAV